MRDYLNPFPSSLEDLLKNRLFEIPVYQRPYSWDVPQINVLLNDLFNEFNIDQSNKYYVGNIIIKKNVNKYGIDTFDIIDGQQRITSFILIFLVLYSIALSRDVIDTDRTIINLKNILWKDRNRENIKELRCISLSSLEKECFDNIYDECFCNPTNLINYVETYEYESNFEDRIIKNIIYTYKWIDEKLSNNNNELLNFTDYILSNVYFIIIDATNNENNIFSMFESINSKGKKLDTIDLIKSFIFSVIDKQSYELYLKKWGELIIKTNDNLYDYLLTYIKAYLYYYRQNINIENFKSICSKELVNHFRGKTGIEAIKALIDDLIEKSKYYNMLYSYDNLSDILQNNQLRFYYKIFTEINYKHPRSLFFRLFIELSQNNISKDNAIDIIKEIIIFMVKFLTISGKSSKEAITMFSNILNNIYDNKNISKDYIIAVINAELENKAITDNSISQSLKSLDAYENNKKLTIALLAWYESTITDKKGKLKTSWDQAYNLIHSFNKVFSIDHLLVQKPDPKSDKFKYYLDEKTGLLHLKEGNDFPNSIQNIQDYEYFTTTILNKIGNLRIAYRDKNSSRNNKSILLKNYGEFTTYSQIEQREEDLINLIVKSCLHNTNSTNNNLKKHYSSYPKMNKLIEFGLIKPGDKLYITISPNNSVAELLDEKYVLYNNKKMTLNEWGCFITKWSTINIYKYAAIVDEIETLHEKRIKYQNENDELYM